MIINVEEAYRKLLDSATATKRNRLIGLNDPNTFYRNYTERDAENSYAMDAAMWYGIIRKGFGYSSLIQNMFILIYYGGLMYKNTNNVWQKWAEADIPIAAVPSHGGRVMVQLPVNAAEAQNFWDWLWGGPAVHKRTRSRSTHEVSELSFYEILPCNRKKFIKEEKTKLGSGKGQYGVNIPMGGLGNINPFSGQTITDDGRFGHLFLYFKMPVNQTHGAMLIGSEASGPSDHDVSHVGTNDQYGGSHGWGGSTTFEATGGRRWQDPNWEGHTAGVKGGYDFFFIDLSRGWNYLSLKQFDPAMIGQYGEAPSVAVDATLISLHDWLSKRNVHGKPNDLLQSLDRLIEGFHRTHDNGRKRFLLLQIIQICQLYINQKEHEGRVSQRVQAVKDLKKEAKGVLSTL